MNKDKLDEAIEKIKEEIKKYDNFIKNLNQCKHIVFGGINYKEEIKDKTNLKYPFVFILQELTKIKNGEYVHKSELLSEEEIVEKLSRYSYLCQDHEGLQLQKTIAIQLSSKIAKPKIDIDRKRVKKILKRLVIKENVYMGGATENDIDLATDDLMSEFEDK
jgi:uncharacterized membrane-anchored protein YjiN (DUF445 family)